MQTREKILIYVGSGLELILLVGVISLLHANQIDGLVYSLRPITSQKSFYNNSRPAPAARPQVLSLSSDSFEANVLPEPEPANNYPVFTRQENTNNSLGADSPSENFSNSEDSSLVLNSAPKRVVLGNSPMEQCLERQINTDQSASVCFTEERERVRAQVQREVAAETQSRDSVKTFTPKINNATAYNECMNNLTGGKDMTPEEQVRAMKTCETESERTQKYTSPEECLAEEIKLIEGSPIGKVKKAGAICEEQFGDAKSN